MFIKDRMPSKPLDGELWVKYGSMTSAAALLKSRSMLLWKQATYVKQLMNNGLYSIFS